MPGVLQMAFLGPFGGVFVVVAVLVMPDVG
jgi:hypothetical protein